MKFIVGCDLPTFIEYYKTCGRGDLQDTEKRILMDDPSHCILWVDEKEILGHVLWHECSTFEHKKGDPRDKRDKKILEFLFGVNKSLVELHEVWLKEEFRGKGFGRDFFGFFEVFILKRGFKNILFYADHPAALNICRNRGYKEIYYEEHEWYVFGKILE
ncbi:MAG: GNAT family N-acetyltransferase [Candidatus Hodarchaeota archaeon]